MGRNYLPQPAWGYKEYDHWKSDSAENNPGIKDRMSEFVKVEHAQAHLGLPFEYSRQGKMAWYDLDYPLLVKELGFILEPNLQVTDVLSWWEGCCHYKNQSDPMGLWMATCQKFLRSCHADD